MEQGGHGSAVEGGPRPDPGTDLEEPLWQLSLEGRSGGETAFPERPGVADCNYYMRTGSCGYGERCRYNHPRDRPMVVASAKTGGEYPERVGQPVCQYFMKTGSCKFGASCKYQHTRQGAHVVNHSQLNVYGFPLRPGEKECSYYMKTGNCKFGATCKFHHPHPSDTSMGSHAPVYPMIQSPPVHSSHQLSAVSNWQVARSPSQMPGPYVQAPYGPMIFSSGMVPVSGWGPFPPTINPVVPPGAQPAVEAGSLYGLSHHFSPSAPTYIGPYQAVSPSSGLAGPSSSGQREHLFPERPGQPECQYYMKTGDCKFGSTCKYHHPPPEQSTSYFLNPMGLPLRPGAPSCTFFAQHGVCKFGPSCKFDHPMTFGYSPLTSSAGIPVPYSVGISGGTLAPSSSSTDLHHAFVGGPSSNETFSTQMLSSVKTSSTSISSIVSKDSVTSHSLAQAPHQSSTPSTTLSSSHGGEVASSR